MTQACRLTGAVDLPSHHSQLLFDSVRNRQPVEPMQQRVSVAPPRCLQKNPAVIGNRSPATVHTPKSHHNIDTTETALTVSWREVMRSCRLFHPHLRNHNLFPPYISFQFSGSAILACICECSRFPRTLRTKCIVKVCRPHT